MEDPKFALEETMGEGLTRRELVRRTAAAGAGLGLLGTISVEDAFARTDKLDRVRWISPRGTLDVMDDDIIRVPIQMSDYKKLIMVARLSEGAEWRDCLLAA